MSQFTEADAKEMGSPLPLLQKWEWVMSSLWKFFFAYRRAEPKVNLRQDRNEIYFKLNDGHQFIIGCYMYNNSFLSLNVKIEGNDDFDVSITHIDQYGEAGIIKVLSAILTNAERVQ